MDTRDNFTNPDAQNMQRKNNKRAGFLFKWLGIVLFSTFMAVAGSGYWLLNTTPGLQWLLSTAERISNSNIQFKGVYGTVNALQINRVKYQDDTLQLAINQLKLDWSIKRLFSGKLLINNISAELIDIHTSPSEEEAETVLPEDLSLPLDVSVKTLQIDEIRIYSIDPGQDGQQPYKPRQPDFSLTDLSLRLESNATQHQLIHLSFNSIPGILTASGKIQTTHPFNLESTVLLNDTEKWGQTQVALTGKLERIDVHLTHHNEPMQARLDAQVQPFAISAISIVTSLNAAITEFNPATLFPETPDIPQANLALQLALSQDTENNLTGQLMFKNKTASPLDQGGLPVTEINSAVLFTEDDIKLDNLRILISEKEPEGIISGNVAWHFSQEFGLADLNVSNLNPAIVDTQLQTARISGLIQLTGDADKQKAEIRLSDQALKLDASVTHTASQVLLEHFNLSHGKSSLAGKGELNLANENSADDSQPFRFDGQLRQFNIADFVQAPESNLNAALSVTGNLSPTFSGLMDYQIEKSHLNRQSVTGKGHIAVQLPLSITSRADLQIGSNHVGIHGKFGKLGDTLALDITAPSLAQIGFGLSGFLKTQIKLTGSIDAPAVDIDIDSEKLTLPGHLSIDNLTAKGKIHPETLSLLLTAHQFRSDGETQFKQLNLKVNGTKSKHTIQTDLRVNEATTVTLQAEGGIYGSTQRLNKPDTLPGWDGHLAHLTITGQVPAELESPAPIKLSSELITLRNARFKFAGGQASIETIFWSPHNWESTGQFSGIGLHPDSELIPKENMLQLGGRWDLRSTASLTQLNGNIEITRERGDWYFPGEFPQPVGLETLKLYANAQNGKLTAQFDLISKHIGEAKGKLSLPIIHSEGSEFLPPHTKLDGQLSLKTPDLSWLDHLTDGTTQTGGQVELHASIAGSLGKPELQGNINGKKLSIALLDLGMNLHQGQLAAHFDQSALHIDQLRFLSPYEPPPKDRLLRKLELEDKAGSLDITGSLGFRENTHQLTVSLDHIYLVHPPHYWIAASGKGTARFINNVLDLDGKIIADAGLLSQPPTTRPQLADDIIIADNKSDKQKVKESKAVEQETIVNLHATLDLGKQFFLRVAGLEGRLDGKLHLQNDENQALSVVGSIATRETTFKAYGQDLTVERGIVNFHGPIDDPGLNILAKRKGLEVEAGVEVAGSVRHPKIKLVSTPHVPDTEKLSWIVLGRAPDTSGLDTSLLITAASSILGGQSSSITEQLSDMLGVDEISFRQASTPGNTQTSTGIPGPPLTSPMGLAASTLSGQIGTIGKRLSSRAYLSYERGITTTTAGITKLTYSLTPKINIVTQAGEDSAIDLFYTFRLD